MMNMTFNWTDLLWAALLLGAFFVGLRLGAAKGGKADLVDRFMKMTDEDQKMALVALALILSTAMALTLILFVLLTKTYDAVVIGLISTVLTLILSASWKDGFASFFTSARAIKPADESTPKADQ